MAGWCREVGGVRGGGDERSCYAGNCTRRGLIRGSGEVERGIRQEGGAICEGGPPRRMGRGGITEGGRRYRS